MASQATIPAHPTDLSDAESYLAAARRSAAAPAALSGVEPRAVGRVGVVGAGLMGTGIAIAAARAGYPTTLIDLAPAATARAQEKVRADFASSVAKGRLTAEDADRQLAAFTFGSAYADVAACDLVIEAAFESMAVKTEILGHLDRLCGPDTILATNTSTLDLDAIAGATGRPANVVGLHFFSPAQVMPLVEIVRGARTSPATLATGLAFSHSLKKAGVIVGNCYGFAGNRMIEGYSREANYLLLEGNPPAAVDAALKAFGMAMGPFEIADLVGIDVPYRARQENSQALPGDESYYRMADLLVSLGRFGQKTGRGYYVYEAGARRGSDDPELMELARSEAERLGIAERRVSAEQIQDRCLLPIINEGARVLGEGIAANPSDLDLIYTLGYGFPTATGGPMRYADRVGLAAIYNKICDLKSTYRAYWEPAPLLAELATSDRTLASLNQP